VVVDLVHADAEEVDEHQLDDGPHALDGRADAQADERGLGDRRVDDPGRAEPVQQPGGGAEDAAVRADVLAEVDHRLVAFHLGGDAVDHGLGRGEAVGFRGGGHAAPPGVAANT
jgi:hypothetical protein